MKFDDLLNTLFRKGGLLIIILVIAMVMSLSGCLLTEFMSCACLPLGYMCGCEDMCAEACWSCGEQCDRELYDSFYLMCPDECAALDCLFDDGCSYETEDCAVSCGGLGTGFYSKNCRDERPPHSGHTDGCLCSCGYCEAGCDDCYFRCGQDNCGE